MTLKVAIVTGATKGIGLATAQHLVKQGYHVVGTHVQHYDADFLNPLMVDGLEFCRVDVSDYESCDAFSKQILERFSSIDVLVNNAGITDDQLMLMMTPDAFNRVLQVNLGGAFNMVKVFTRSMMKARKGSIVNIASVIGEIGNPGQANYAAAKAGLIGFSKTLAKEFASRNIRVNCVAPGFIETAMTHALPEATRSQILNQIALKQFGQAQDVANAVAFLVSDNAAYITGQTLNVCGGMVI